MLDHVELLKKTNITQPETCHLDNLAFRRLKTCSTRHLRSLLAVLNNCGKAVVRDEAELGLPFSRTIKIILMEGKRHTQHLGQQRCPAHVKECLMVRVWTKSHGAVRINTCWFWLVCCLPQRNPTSPRLISCVSNDTRLPRKASSDDLSCSSRSG